MRLLRRELELLEDRGDGGEAVEIVPGAHFALALRTDAALLLFLVTFSVNDVATRKAHGASGLVTERFEADAALRRFPDFTERSIHRAVVGLQYLQFFL